MSATVVVATPGVASSESTRWRRQRRQRILDELRGVPRGVTSRRAVEAHLDALVALGFSWGSIMSAAGLRTSQPALAHERHRQNTYLRHANLYLALTPQIIFDRAAEACKVSSFASIRRYQALQRIGWTQAHIEAATVEHGGTHAWCNMLKPGERVSAGRHRALRAAYDVLSTTQGPSKATTRMAITKGFLPPLAWDDIDDPTEDPTATDKTLIDDIAIERVLAGDWAQLTSPEINELLHRGAARGLDCGQMARLLHMSKSAISRRANRLGIQTTSNYLRTAA